MEIGVQNKTRNENILDFWKSENSGFILESHADLDNPLEEILSEMKVNFNTGGYFNITQVKWYSYPNYYLDIQILIESINDPENYKKLKELHERSMNN